MRFAAALAALFLLPLPAVASEQRDALQTLLREPQAAGAQVRVTKSGRAQFLRRGALPLAHAKGDDHESRKHAALEYIARHARAFGLRDPMSELVLTRFQTGAAGKHHYVFEQRVNGVPVHGGEARAHFDADGAMYALNLQTAPELDVATEPRIAADDALATARAKFQSANVRQDAARLEIREMNGAHALVYTVTSFVDDVNRWQSVIDARSGELLRHRLDHRDGSVDGYGIDLNGKGHSFNVWERTDRYHLVDVKVPTYSGYEDPLVRMSRTGDTYVWDLLNSEGESSQTVASSAATSRWDPAAVSAIGNGQIAYRYFRDEHGRQGIDGRNANLVFAIHYGEQYDNAFWNGEAMVFGDGGTKFTNLAGCLDIVAHEMSHGVIASSADLIYENQSGALNESFADVFGVLIEGENWRMGEGCTKVTPGHIRDLKDPHNGRRRQPAHMSEYQVLPNTEDGDYGGVHVNSGIPNRAAYLLMEGLTDEGLGASIGRRMAGKLYYRALTVYLGANSQFIDLRRAMLLAADDLYPGDAHVHAAVNAAFDAVGIVEGKSAESTTSTPSGTGANGSLKTSRSLLDFGDVTRGETKALAVTLSNDGDDDIVIHDVVSSADAFTHDFTNTRLAPGETITGRVTFTPAAASGTVAAVLEVRADGDDSLAIDLVANAVEDIAAERAPSAGGGGALHPLFALALLMIAGVRRRLR